MHKRAAGGEQQEDDDERDFHSKQIRVTRHGSSRACRFGRKRTMHVSLDDQAGHFLTRAVERAS